MYAHFECPPPHDADTFRGKGHRKSCSLGVIQVVDGRNKNQSGLFHYLSGARAAPPRPAHRLLSVAVLTTAKHTCWRLVSCLIRPQRKRQALQMSRPTQAARQFSPATVIAAEAWKYHCMVSDQLIAPALAPSSGGPSSVSLVVLNHTPTITLNNL